MLDVIAPGAAVFEPEEVDVLAAACGLAIKKIDEEALHDPDTREEVARLVHNLARSRIKHRKRMKDAADAAALAEEAADLLGYLRETPEIAASADVSVQPSTRAVPFFPADLRSPPTTVLKPRVPDLASTPDAKPKRERGHTARPARRSRSVKQTRGADQPPKRAR